MPKVGQTCDQVNQAYNQEGQVQSGPPVQLGLASNNMAYNNVT